MGLGALGGVVVVSILATALLDRDVSWIKGITVLYLLLWVASVAAPPAGRLLGVGP